MFRLNFNWSVYNRTTVRLTPCPLRTLTPFPLRGPSAGTFGGVLRGPSAGGRTPTPCASGLRARCRVGLWWFIDLHVTMNSSYTLNEAHTATEAIEKAIQATIATAADVTIHVEPAEAAVVKPQPLQGRGRRAKRNTKQVRDER